MTGRWAAHYLESQVHGVKTGDWTAIVGTAVVMSVVAPAASIVPTRKALSLAPTDALRTE